MPEGQSRKLQVFGIPAGLLVGLGVVSGLAFVFLKLWSEIAEGETHALDSAILLALRVGGHSDQPIGPSWLSPAMIALTNLGSGLVLAAVLCATCFYLLAKGARLSAAILLVSSLSGALVVVLMKDVFARPRPDIVAHLVPANLMSFPSGHAANSALVYLAMGAILSEVQTRARSRLAIMGVAILLTLAIGLSRVYLGIHWPSDVVGGWCFGAGWALAWQIALHLVRGRQARPEG